MIRLVNEVAKSITARMVAIARSLRGDTDLRSVFHGPPMKYLRPVMQVLVAEGGIEVELGDGSPATIPVLLPLLGGEVVSNPLIPQSGLCNPAHILAVRNTPDCKRFLTLAPPAQHDRLSMVQATDEFGLAAENNGANTQVFQWFDDGFIRHLADTALSRIAWRTDHEREQGRTLLRLAVEAADEVDRHDPGREHAWAALSRVLAIGDVGSNSGSEWSLACGVPPTADGNVDAELQGRALRRLSEAMVSDGFSATIVRMRGAASASEVQALDECLRHIELTCHVRIALEHSAMFYYGPFQDDQLGVAPDWWRVLTAERLLELLEDDDTPVGSLTFECLNSILPTGTRLPAAVVLDEVHLALRLPDEVLTATAVAVRAAGPQANAFQWSVNLPEQCEVTDDEIPVHKQPLRYTAVADGVKKASIRVVSLAHWEPGVVVSCRTAKKVSLPKKAQQGGAIECDLLLIGEGRHYLDLHVSPGLSVLDEVHGEDLVSSDVVLEGSVSASAAGAYGFELQATSECRFELTIQDGTGATKSLRLNITSQEAPAEGCRSEFDRLIRLNRDRPSAHILVQLERQVRTADLQSWILSEHAVSRSYYPLALGTDCSDRWTEPNWSNQADTVLSRGTFLHDPRPGLGEFEPPPEWLHVRSVLAKKIRGEDGYGLVEQAELAVWMRDKAFADAAEAYLRGYLRWLESAPEIAAFVDIAIVCNLEADGRTLAQEPDAIVVSPMHPLRIGWHCLAQRALHEAWQRNMPCPAASILDPDSVPDSLTLPLRSPSAVTKHVSFVSTECSSDYWTVLWNGSRLDKLGRHTNAAPFGKEFGIELGGVSSGFSVSQVKRALDDVAALSAARPVLNVLVSSSSGHGEACNSGLMSWALEGLPDEHGDSVALPHLGERLIQIFDERESGTPEAADLANLAEDSAGTARWFRKLPHGVRPDLGIIAQLETSNPAVERNDIGSPLSAGALIRHRIRTQLSAGAGAFLAESRTGIERSTSGDGFADTVMRCAVRLENLGDARCGYTFAPNVQAITTVLKEKNAEYVAVSSAAVDPSCFLGGWLDDVYLWDYDLPSYSHRAGDTNGYYLLSQVKGLDCERLSGLLARLPGCDGMDDSAMREVLLEVARRGIPTVRGLSTGHSGAAGDLGLFLAGRLLQDEFRTTNAPDRSMFQVLASDGETTEVVLVVPVDPFKSYMQDLQRALGIGQFSRPDLLIVGLVVTASSVRCRLTPVEVKYRREEVMSPQGCLEALSQAASMSTLLNRLNERAGDPDMLLWRLGFQHLLCSMLDFGFRVYSHHQLVTNTPREWAALHQRVIAAVLGEELLLEIDGTGRLLLFDGGGASGPRDVDGDEFKETIQICTSDAALIVRDAPSAWYEAVRMSIGDWRVFPTGTSRVVPRSRMTVEPAPAETEKAPADLAPAAHDLTNLDIPVAASSVGPVVAAPSATVPDDRENGPQLGISILIGKCMDDFRSDTRRFSPSDTALNQLNIGVVGDLGTGKTQLLKSIIYQLRLGSDRNGGVKPRVLIVDYKKDYSSEEFVKAVGAKVVIPRHLPLNMFDVSAVQGDMIPWMGRYKFFADVLDKIYPGVGPVQRDSLKQAVKQAYAGCVLTGVQPTIYDVHEKYRARLQGKTDSPLSIIGDMVDMELFTPNAAEGGGFDTFFDGVVVLSLDALGQDDQTKHLLVAVMLNMFYEHMLRIPKRPYRGTNPQLRTVDSYLLVDEADSIMRYEFDVLRKILLQGREFGVGVILASQYLRHFKVGGTDYREPLLTWLIHKVPNVLPQELAALGLPNANQQMADRIRQLPNHHCLFKTEGVVGEVIQGEPFYKLLEGIR